MAYGVKYRFPFESVDGVSWTIDILKNGYSGSILTRAMGGAPALRKDQNGCIHGTSLDLIAECAVDGEFQELSTSDPFAFQVKVYHGEGTFMHTVWQGYVTPEIYNAPEIAPPYDVNITATDGLGELKQHYYEPLGSVTVAWLLSSLLSYTGLSLSVKMVSDLHPNGESLDVGVWSGIRINLDYMSGETCYDVLQTVLASMHASITQTESAWAIIKETGMTVEVANSLIRYPGSGSSFTIDIPRFGQLSAHQGGFWPVGQMTREYVAPKKKIVLTSANHYRSDLASGSWTVDGQASYESSYYSLPQSGSQISKTISFSHEIRKHLMLSVKVRNVGEGSNVGTLVVYVKLTGHSYGGTVFYLVNGTGNRRREAMDVTWSPSSGTCSFEVQAPMESDTDQDYITLDILLPLYNNSARYYMGATSLDITIANGDSTYPKRVYGIDLYQYEQTAGFQKIVNIDNGARGEAPGVDMSVACLQGSNAYVGIEQMQYGVLMDSDYEKISAWDTNAFSNKDYFDLLSRDYALSYASARVRMSGILNTDPEWNAIPVMFIDDHDNVPYLVESLSWDLRNDEITVQMLSLPASSISVDSEGLEEGVTDNSTGHTQGNPSSGGGGGGGGTGTVTSVELTMPAAFDVDGSPITGAGTLQVTLKQGFSITTDAERNRIPSNEQSQHWEQAYQLAHTHDNKSVLDGITAAKVAQWDSAAGGGMGPDELGIPAPLVKITLGDGARDSSIRIWHPLLAADSEAEAVLMVKGRKTRSKHGSYRPESANVHDIRKGWMVARTYTGDRSFTFFIGTDSYSATALLDSLRTYIIRYYTKVSGRNRSQMASLSYAAWETYSTSNFGWERAFNSHTSGRFRKMFGVAIRVPNPDFDRAASHQHNLTEHTQSLPDPNGYPVPRYIYSAVAPILVQITERSNGGICLGLEVK